MEAMTTHSKCTERSEIKIGDQVRVVFARGEQEIEGVVRYMPQEPGECWVIESQWNIFYVQTFQCIAKAK